MLVNLHQIGSRFLMILFAMNLWGCASPAPVLFPTQTPAAALTYPAYVRKEDDAEGVIIFIHGFTGDAKDTWTNTEGEGVYWPELLIEDEVFDGFDIYVYDYPTSVSGGNLSIDEIAAQMQEHFRHDGIDEYQNIVFVAHSMGGIVARVFLNNYQQRAIVSNVRFVFFYGTPTSGTTLANLARVFSRNPQIEQLAEMRRGNYLSSLAITWREADHALMSYCAYETDPTNGIVIVDLASSNALCDDIEAISSDHIQLVKPPGVRDFRHIILHNAFKEVIHGVRDADGPNLTPMPTIEGTCLSAPDARVSAESSRRTTITPSNANNLELKWDIPDTGDVWDIDFSPDSSRLAFVSGNHHLEIWDVFSDEPSLSITYTHPITYGAPIEFSPDGKFVATGGWDGNIHLWNATTGVEEKWFGNHDAWITSLDFSDDGSYLVSGSNDGTAMLWDLDNMAHDQTFEVNATERVTKAIVLDVEFAPSFAIPTVYAVTNTGYLYTFQQSHENADGTPASSDPYSEIALNDGNWIRSIDMSCDEHTLAAGSKINRPIMIWDEESRQVTKIFQGHEDMVRSVEFSPDGTLLASGAEDGTLRIWPVGIESTTQLEEYDVSFGKWVRSVTFSPDQTMIATAGRGGKVLVWTAKTTGE